MKGIYIFSIGLMLFSMVMFPLFSMEKIVIPEAPTDLDETKKVKIYIELLKIFKEVNYEKFGRITGNS